MLTKEKAQAFVDEYNELCKKHGVKLVSYPVWKQTNHGTFELEIEFKVAEVNSAEQA